MKENRKQLRIPLIYYLAVFEKKSDQLIGYLADISSGGAMVLAEMPLVIGDEYSFLIESFSMQSETRRICFDAECVWSGSDKFVDYYRCGLRMTNIASEDIDEIMKLVNAFRSNV